MSEVSFGRFVADARAEGRLVVQPRMGFGGVAAMRAGLLATKRVAAATAGTITVDSYTRVGDHRAAAEALRTGADLNGYPIVAHGAEVTRGLAEVQDATFPVQVRHGSALPEDIFVALAAAGLSASEGGPVSYCLPYGRTPLAVSVRNWAGACEFLARLAEAGRHPHLETFGGCLLGQLCPPGLLVAVSVLEAMFFRQHGLRSVSLSYAQQTSPAQDESAVAALRSLAAEFLPDVDWHVVVYAYMGRFARTPGGARLLLESAARLARRTGAERLIVKTVAEAHRIPTVAENVDALRTAASAGSPVDLPAARGTDSATYEEASALVGAVLAIDDDLGRALTTAFALGVLDVPFCLHPDNAGRSMAHLDDDGWLRWSDVGSMPITAAPRRSATIRTAAELLSGLTYVQRTFDTRAAATYRDIRE